MNEFEIGDTVEFGRKNGHKIRSLVLDKWNQRAGNIRKRFGFHYMVRLGTVHSISGVTSTDNNNLRLCRMVLIEKSDPFWNIISEDSAGEYI